MNTHSNGKICFADFEIDTAHRLLTRRGQTVALNAKAFDVLEFLAENAGRVVTKNEILDAVWADQFVEEANLKVQISTLRKALGEQKDEHRFLVTLPGKGYKFVADTRIGNGDVVIEKHRVSHVVVEEETEISDLTTDVHESREVRATRLPRLMLLAGVVVGIVAIGGGFWLVNSRRESQSVAPLAAASNLTIKRLTSQGRVNRVKLSPDGHFFAYTVRQRGSFATELRIGQTDGASDVTLRPVTASSQYPISFSSDGNWLYYVETPAVSEYSHSEGTLYKVPVLRGVPQKVSGSISVFAVMSPDEKQVAFPRSSSEGSSIIVADIDGSNERAIAARPPGQFIDIESLSWSADARLIAFASATGRSRIDSSRSSFEVFVVDVTDDTVEQLTRQDWNRITVTEWIKDGSGVLAVGRSSEQLNASSLWLINYPDGATRRLSQDVNRYAWMSLSADSQSMVVVQAQIETNLWVAPVEGLPDAKQITFSSPGRQDGWYGVDWTPDGEIVYTAFIDESLTLWIMNANGENARQLTSIGFRDERPAVTTDGRFIVFQSNRSGATEIWRMNVDGSNLTRLTTDGGGSLPSLTPDGVWVVYRNASEKLSRIPLNGGEPVMIADQEVQALNVSPDGKLVACAATFEKKKMLAIYPIEGGAPLRLFDLPETSNTRRGYMKWTRDGRYVTYTDATNGIWMQDVNGGDAVRMEGIPPEQTFSYAWSRDGKQFTYGRTREVRDAILISNFR